MRALAPLALAAAAAGAGCAAAPAAESVAAGGRLYARCHACHALEPGRSTPAGPTLHRIVGRAVAAEPGFAYSPALRALAAAQPRWTPALLDAFLADPDAVAPGHYMGFHGLDDPAERRALIDWLRADRSGAP